MAYLDHAATTPMLPEAVEAYVAAAREVGNASSLHGPGRCARRKVEEARERVAAALGARPSEVIFTGGGTESDNLAVKGIFWARRPEGRCRVVASSIEHHAVLDAVHWLEAHEDAKVTWLPVDGAGRVDPATLAEALDDDVALVTVMWANNEVGTLQPIPELAGIAGARGIPMHTDAVQAIGQVPVAFALSGVSALTVTGHKIGGPVGVGALLLGREVACVPLLHGGGQERDVRSGTLDVPGIVAFATALDLTVRAREQAAARLAALRDELISRVREIVPDAVLNGDPADRLPGNAHFAFPGCEGDALLMLLDAQGIACSTGSACSAGIAQPSHVLLAMGCDPVLARSSLRFTLGHDSTSAEIDALIAALPGAVERARRAGMLRNRA
ncbi:cysteine desulfurase family protein [Hamadaea tsunoensis]|uniref:cysteine desulfurase family protein n=1 Tax=Hamadaea tsunoensis TaxID=53368 RepID=UPI00042573D8|nr:cysteine desulfurase family protein [Hamadaea tsunoensis]